MDDCYAKAKEILSKEKDLVKLIAETLLEYETLTKEQIDYLVENGEMPEIESLSDFNLAELKTRAKAAGVKGYNKMTKDELVDALDNLDNEANEEVTEEDITEETEKEEE